MIDKKIIPTNKKLVVQFRLEPGCLGPDGDEHIEDFCNFAQKEFQNFNTHFAQWEITPRFDKSLPEIQYRINGKRLEHRQVSKYLQLFQSDIDIFEDNLDNKLTLLIDQYLSH
ncbi:MAG: hypothetical protein ACPGJI_00205 [Kangiellaceae bacterium]